MISKEKLRMAQEVEDALLHKIAEQVMLENNPVPDVMAICHVDDFLANQALAADLFSNAENMTPEVLYTLLTKHDAGRFISSLDSVLLGASITPLSSKLRKLSLERAMVSRAMEVITLANQSDEVPASMKYAKALELFQMTESATRFTNAYDAIGNLYETIRDRKDDRTVGIPTGYAKFDQHTNGLKPGKLYVVAGSPGMGKTVIALNWSLSAALSGKHVMYYSLEMSTEEMTARLMSALTNTTSLEIERAGRNADFLDVITRKRDAYADVFKRIHIRAMENFGDGEDASAMQVISDFRHLKASGNEPGLVVIDYLGLMEHGDNMNLASAIGKTTRLLKKLAGRWGVPVVLLAQVSKEVLKRPDPRPVLSDLRDSGHIEQDADLVAFIYRERHAKGTNTDLAEVIIAKNRSGISGAIVMKDKTMYYKLEDLDGNVA